MSEGGKKGRNDNIQQDIARASENRKSHGTFPHTQQSIRLICGKRMFINSHVVCMSVDACMRLDLCTARDMTGFLRGDFFATTS